MAIITYLETSSSIPPHQKVLMLVDVIFPGWIPFPYLAVANDVTGFIKAHDIALNRYDFDTFVGGHLTRLGTRDDVKVQEGICLGFGKCSIPKQITMFLLSLLQSR